MAENDIIMLDMSEIHQIPYHLQRILCSQNFSPIIDVLTAFVYYVAMECGFVSSRVDASQYAYTWFFSFDKRIFEDFQCQHFSRKMSLKFVMSSPSHEVFLECLKISGDIALIVIYEMSDQKIVHCESVAFPISRYMPFKKLINPLPVSFRNLKELSFKLKHEIFHPLRNQIYQERALTSTPSLNGVPESCLIRIYKYLDANSKHNLNQTCKTQHVNLLNYKKTRH